MKLAISNIGWPQERTGEVLSLLNKLNVKGFEIAPTKFWDNPLTVKRNDIHDVRSFIEAHNLSIVGMHSLFFPRNDLGLFKSLPITEKTVQYMEKLIEICAELGGKTLIFGSPINRKRGDIPWDMAFSEAVDFFSRLSPIAYDQGTCICIEPLGPSETDFISTSSEARLLVNAVNHPGFGIQLDVKSLFDSKENIEESIDKSLPGLKHIHVNDPGLNIVGSTGKIDHYLVAKCLKNGNYDKYISIEQKTLPEGDPVQNIRKSVEFVKKVYFGGRL